MTAALTDPRTCEYPAHYDVACRCGRYITRRTCNAQFVRVARDPCDNCRKTGAARRCKHIEYGYCARCHSEMYP